MTLKVRPPDTKMSIKGKEKKNLFYIMTKLGSVD
jgi:hypothetical protein